MVESYMTRAVMMYQLNEGGEERESRIDAERDTADIDAALALSGQEGRFCEV